MSDMGSNVPPNVSARIAAILALFRQLLGMRRVLLMLASSLLVSMIEFAGLALIFPFIKIVIDPAHYLRQIEQQFPIIDLFADQRAFVAAVGAAMLVFYILKGFLQARLIRYQADVGADINRLASHQLIEGALHARYQLFQDLGAVKIAGASYSSATHATLLFQSMVAASNEIVLSGFVLAGMFVLSPSASIAIILVLAALATGVFVPLSRRVASIGRQTQLVDLARHRFVFAMASAIRDIKIMGLETSFVKRNRVIVDQQVDLSAEYVAISAVQRVAVEIIMVCAVVLGGAWMVFFEKNLAQVAPLLVTFGLVAVRAAPAISRLVGAYNGFRYSLPHVENLIALRASISDYPQPRHNERVEFCGTYAIEKICFAYRDTPVLHEVSLSIGQGEVVGIVGPSGSGKSTLLDLVSGLQSPSSGGFYLNGVPFDPFASKEFSRRIGYVPQSIALLDASIEFNISLEDVPNGERLSRAIRTANLSELIESLPQGVKTMLGEGGQGISGGQRQRIGIARALYREPQLLILDEVTSALDANTEAMVMGELLGLRGQTTLLIVTHKLANVARADRVYRLEGGKLSIYSGDEQD